MKHIRLDRGRQSQSAPAFRLQSHTGDDHVTLSDYRHRANLEKH